MATATQGAVRQTFQDYCATPDDERYELLDGKLMMVPAPNMKHQQVLVTLTWKLRSFTEEQGLGKVYVAPCDVVLSDTDVVQPDLLFISRAREHILTDDNVRGAPDLVIEILSPSTRRPRPGLQARPVRETRRARVLDRRSDGRNDRRAPARRRQARSCREPRSGRHPADRAARGAGTQARRHLRRLSKTARSKWSRTKDRPMESSRRTAAGHEGTLRGHHASGHAPG